MIKIVRTAGEDDDRMLKRFKRAVERSGLIAELKRREYYDKQEKRKKKHKIERLREAESR